MGLRLFLLTVLALLVGSACADRGPRRVDVPASAEGVRIFNSQAAQVHAGKTDLTDFKQAGMAGEGWALPLEGAPRPEWIWGNARESIVWIAGSPAGGEAQRLKLEVRAPGFTEVPYSVDVELNDVDLGSRAIKPDTESITLGLPTGFKLLPMNRLVLTGSSWISPRQLGVGSDSRRLSFSFRSAALGVPGEELLVRRLTLPPGALIENAGATQAVDLLTLAPVQTEAVEDGKLALWPSEVDAPVALIAPRSQAVATATLTAPAGNQSLVLIVIDTLRADAIDLVPTPNIDRLREAGVEFREAFANAPMTLPSHTALFSGRLPSSSGVVNNGQVVPQDLPLIPERLKDEGYRTWGVVSIETLWPGAPGTGPDRGFLKYQRAGDQLPLGDQTAALLSAGIRAGQLDQPFFLFAHFSDPHDPYRSHAEASHPLVLKLDDQPIAEVEPRRAEALELELKLSEGQHSLHWVSADDRVAPLSMRLELDGEPLSVDFVQGGIREFQKETRASFSMPETGRASLKLWLADYPEGQERILRYAGEVAAVDRAVGRLLDELDSAGVLDSSLVVFTADHGEAFAEHGYLGHVEHLYDEMLRVPLIIRPPLEPSWDRVREALLERAEGVVSLVDLAPTMLELLGRSPSAGSEGHSLLDPAGENPAVRAETHKPEASRDLYCIRSGDWKLIYAPDTLSFELYDMQRDPRELTNLFGEQGASFEVWQSELRQRAARWATGPQPERDPSTSADLGALGY